MECTAAVSCCFSGFGIGIALCFYVRPHFGICVAICLGFGVCMLWLARTGRGLFCYAGIDDDWPRMGKNHLFFAEHSILAGGWIHSRRHS